MKIGYCVFCKSRKRCLVVDDYALDALNLYGTEVSLYGQRDIFICPKCWDGKEKECW